MPTYILLLTMTPEGREWMLDDPESLLRAESDISVPGVQLMGLYGVLGDYDFVSLVDAPDNDAVARFSLELGVKGGAHITTLPAIPIMRFAETGPREPQEIEADAPPPRPEGPSRGEGPEVGGPSPV